MDEHDAILQAVADGDLSAAEAVLRLDALDRGEAPPSRTGLRTGGAEASSSSGASSQRGASSRRGASGEGGLRTVRVTATGRAVKVIGDTRIREAVAEGPHTARRQGDVLVINGEAEDGADEPGGFGFGRPGGWSLPGVPRPPWHGTPNPLSEVGKVLRQRSRPLVVRMSPELALEVEIVAGSATIDGVHGEIRTDVSAGSLRLDGVRAPISATVQAGSVTLTGCLDRGASRIRCEAGAVNVNLDAASSVRVAARSTLSKVTLPGDDTFDLADAMNGRERTATVGAGAATLDIEATMGGVRVVVEEQAEVRA